MRKIGILPNLDKDKDLEYTKEIIDFLVTRGCTPILTEDIAKAVDKPEYGRDCKSFYSNSDFIIVLGGDGTILGASREICKYDVPVMGINLGTVGFLIDVDREHGFKAIDKVLAGNYKIEKRMMMDCKMNLEQSERESFLALNDVAVTKGAYSKLINLNVYVNDEYLATFKGDGIIIATPTGSTAYNLSAGGPILKPDTENMVITPVCPHSFHGRGIVVSGNDVVKIEAVPTTRGEMLVNSDGETKAVFKHNDTVKIKKSEHYTLIIKTTEGSFYDTIRRKLVRNEE